MARTRRHGSSTKKHGRSFRKQRGGVDPELGSTRKGSVSARRASRAKAIKDAREVQQKLYEMGKAHERLTRKKGGRKNRRPFRKQRGSGGESYLAGWQKPANYN